MHELSIAENIIDIVRQYVPETELIQVRGVRLAIGSQSGISAEALEFGYSALVSESALGNSSLNIEIVPYRLRCEECGTEFTSDDGLVACPSCAGVKCMVIAGTEMRLIDIMLADAEEA